MQVYIVLAIVERLLKTCIGTILGLTNCIGSIPGFVAPLVASAIVNGDEDNIAKWRVVWIIAISILVVESIAFIIFAQGNPQSWNAAPEEKETEGKKDWILVNPI